MRKLLAVGAAVSGFIGACSSSDTSSPGPVATASTDGGGPGAPDAGSPPAADAGACTLTAPPAGTPCNTITSPPTFSCALAAWPRFDPATATDLTAQARVTTTSVPGSPVGIVISPDGTKVFNVESASGSGQLSLLDRSGNALTANAFRVTFAASQSPFGLAPSSDGTKLGVGLTSRVSILDLAKTEAGANGAFVGAVDTPLTGTRPSTLDVAFSKDGAFLFGANEYESQVSVSNVTTKTYVGAIPIAANAVTSVVLSPDGKYLYVTAEVADAFKAVKADAGADGTDQNIGLFTIVDAVKATTDPAHAVLGAVFVGRAPVRTVLSEDGAVAWITARGSNALVALDTTKLLTNPACAFLATTAVGEAPVGQALLPGGARIAVANSSRFTTPTPNGTIMLVDTADALAGRPTARRGQITVGHFPRELAADARSIFVSNFDDQTISGLDLTGLP